MVFTVEIDDKSKTGQSLLHLLKNLSKTSTDIHFINNGEGNEAAIKPKNRLKSGKAGKQLADNAISPYKAKVLRGVKQAVKEMNLIKAGKLKARNAEDLINEL